MPRVERELCVARWLAAAGVPAVQAYEQIDQPIMVNGHPVSFWQTVTGGEPTPTHADLARLLVMFHAADDCPCELVTFEPLKTSQSRLAKAAGVSPADRDFLAARCTDLTEQFGELEFALPAGPIHGDAHTSNLLTDHGRVVLLDFEATAIGPREWDLLPTSIARERFGLPDDKYQEFSVAYGFDVHSWPGYPVLREIRQLTMTAWIMQNIGEDPAIAAEFALRVASSYGLAPDRQWRAVPGGRSRQFRTTRLKLGSYATRVPGQADMGYGTDRGSSQRTVWDAEAPRLVVVLWLMKIVPLQRSHIFALHTPRLLFVYRYERRIAANRATVAGRDELPIAHPLLPVAHEMRLDEELAWSGGLDDHPDSD